MSKCDCYYTETKRRYTYNPITGDPIGHDVKVGVCFGTKECDECSCGGDETKCDFYSEVRKKAREERKSKFGEWISVEDRLPSKDSIPDNFIVVAKVGDETVVDLAEMYPYKNYLTGEEGVQWEIFNDWDEGQGCKITHWMPLPQPPKGDNNDK